MSVRRVSFTEYALSATSLSFFVEHDVSRPRSGLGGLEPLAPSGGALESCARLAQTASTRQRRHTSETAHDCRLPPLSFLSLGRASLFYLCNRLGWIKETYE